MTETVCNKNYYETALPIVLCSRKSSLTSIRLTYDMAESTIKRTFLEKLKYTLN